VLKQIEEVVKSLPERLPVENVKMKFNIRLANGTEMPSPYASVLR